MEKKQKTDDRLVTDWWFARGNAWKCVVYLLSVHDLANLSSCSFALKSIARVDRVPWKELSAVMNADVRKAVWADQPKDLGQRIYRWFVLHRKSGDMWRNLFGYFGDAVIAMHQNYEMARTLLSRLSPSKKRYLFCFNDKLYAMTAVANCGLFPMEMTCDPCPKSDKGCCHPDLHGMSFSTRRAFDHRACGGPSGCANWFMSGLPLLTTLDLQDSTIDSKSGLCKMLPQRFSLQGPGPDDGYPHCTRLRCAYTNKNGDLCTYSIQHDIAATAEFLRDEDCTAFDAKKLSIGDFTAPPATTK